MGQDHRADTQGYPLPELMTTAWKGFGVSAQAVEPVLKNAARCNLELMSLAGRRTRAYAELPSVLSRCRTPQDLAGEQMRFWQSAAQDYATSARCFMDAWSSMLAAGMRASADAVPAQRDFITFAESRVDEAPAQVRKPASRRAA